MLEKDPIEQTEEFKKAMEKIDPILNKEFPPNQVQMGRCHQYWFRKKELLKQAGIDWKTPKEMNPFVMFD